LGVCASQHPGKAKDGESGDDSMKHQRILYEEILAKNFVWQKLEEGHSVAMAVEISGVQTKYYVNWD
jgi:hypothetical protein